MPNDPVSDWRDRTAHQLVSYEALFKLLDQIQPLEDVEKIARLVAKQWKYFANVACWRLVVKKDDSFQLIDGFQGTAVLTKTDSLAAWDSYHLTTRLPFQIAKSDLVAGLEPPDHLLKPFVREILVLPFSRQGQCIGLLTVASRNEAFSELDKKFIRLFGSHLTDRIFDLLIRERSMANLVNKATHDDLTGIYNRGAIMEKLSSLFELTFRTKEPLSVILADIDNFKTVNDTFGHITGDRVLSEISRRLQKQARQTDQLGRYGGEEFLFVLYPCNAENVMITAERFRKTIANTPFLIDEAGKTAINLTISLGCSSVQPEDQRVETLLKRADQALYQSKSAGKNRSSVIIQGH